MTAEILALIPARSGSKSVPHKNIRPMAGLPMLAWSVRHALDCPEITRVIVDTDDESYAEIARTHGAETPYLRPKHLAEDASTDLEVFRHALEWLDEKEDYRPDLVVHLRPTCPLRRTRDLSAMIGMLEADPEADSVRSITQAPETPYKMWIRNGDRLEPAARCDVPEAYNAPRQSLPKAWLHNGAIDVLRPRTVLERNSMTGRKILGYEMDSLVDIDTEEQFRHAELRLLVQRISRERKNFCIDIDGVIATTAKDLQYDRAEPIRETIETINILYDRGHHITLFTARGTVTKIDWRETTEGQLSDWGVRYHELRFGKPAADYYIDDRMLTLDQFAGLKSLLKD